MSPVLEKQLDAIYKMAARPGTCGGNARNIARKTVGSGLFEFGFVEGRSFFSTLPLPNVRSLLLQLLHYLQESKIRWNCSVLHSYVAAILLK